MDQEYEDQVHLLGILNNTDFEAARSFFEKAGKNTNNTPVKWETQKTIPTSALLESQQKKSFFGKLVGSSTKTVIYSFVQDENGNIYAMTKGNIGEGGSSRIKPAISRDKKIYKARISEGNKIKIDALKNEFELFEALESDNSDDANVTRARPIFIGKDSQGYMVKNVENTSEDVHKLYSLSPYIYPGQALFKHLQEHFEITKFDPDKPILSEETAVQYTRYTRFALLAQLRCCLVVEKLHKKNIIHRDIKSENFIVVPKSSNFYDFEIKMTDLEDSVRLTGSNEIYHSNVLVGTEGYISPDITAEIPGNDLTCHYSKQTDLYALGRGFRGLGMSTNLDASNGTLDSEMKHLKEVIFNSIFASNYKCKTISGIRSGLRCFDFTNEPWCQAMEGFSKQYPNVDFNLIHNLLTLVKQDNLKNNSPVLTKVDKKQYIVEFKNDSEKSQFLIANNDVRSRITNLSNTSISMSKFTYNKIKWPKKPAENTIDDFCTQGLQTLEILAPHCQQKIDMNNRENSLEGILKKIKPPASVHHLG